MKYSRKLFLWNFICFLVLMWHFSAFFSSALTLNHCAWTVLAGSALSKGLKSQWFLVAYIFVAHFVCTGTSLYNQTGESYFIKLLFYNSKLFHHKNLKISFRHDLASYGLHVVISSGIGVSSLQRGWFQGI